MGCVCRGDLKYYGLDSATKWDAQAIGPYGHGSTFVATGHMDVRQVLSRMQRRDIPILPVEENGVIAGIVSMDQLSASLGRRAPSNAFPMK
jgi:CBS domain-containing protein